MQTSTIVFMLPDPPNPLDQPLQFIVNCIQGGRLFWTYHANMRLNQRSISRRLIVAAVSSLDIIEHYEDDFPFPSYLVRGERDGLVFHIQVAADFRGENIRIITAYAPDPDVWDDTFRSRKGRQ